MKDARGDRLVFGDFIDRIFWALLVGVGAYGVHEIQKLSENVAALNQSMAVVLEKMGSTKERVDKIENRVDDLEKRTSGRVR